MKAMEAYIQQTAEKNSKTKAAEFRIRAKSLFLTYCILKTEEADCQITKESFLNALNERICGTEPAPYIIIAKEQYKDREDAFHFHCVVVFDRTRLFRTPGFADLEFFPKSKDAKERLQREQRKTSIKIHGNYMATRNLSRAISYVKKEGDFLEEGELPTGTDEPKAKKTKISDEIAELLKAGGTVDSIVREYPGFSLQNLHKVVSYKHFVDNNLEEKKIPFSKITEYEVPETLSVAEIQILDFLKQNIGTVRPLRQKQLWIKGPIGSGKTTFATLLDKFLRIYTLIYETDYMEGYEPNLTDLVIFDEFRGQKTLTFLNSFIDGSIKKYNVKYSWTTKRKNHPVIFFSNFSPTECYSKASDVTLDAFIDRLNVVEIVTLYGLCDMLNAIITANSQ